MYTLDIQHLAYQYQLSSRILFHDFNLQVANNDFIILTGSSGSGKTTLTKMILGQITHYDGTIRFQDQIIKTMTKHQIQAMRQHIACVFQDYKLVSQQSIEHNITLPLSITHTPFDEIQDRYHYVSDVLSLDMDPKHQISQLSGWEKQKVAIARSLIMKPDLFIADEPTGNLDEKNSKLITDLIITIHREGIPILFITQSSIQ